MRTLDSLIWDTAFGAAEHVNPEQQTPSTPENGPFSGFGTQGLGEGDRQAVLICHDPTLDLTRAAVATGAPVLFLDSDYARSQEASAMGAEIAGDVRLDELLIGATLSIIHI